MIHIYIPIIASFAVSGIFQRYGKNKLKGVFLIIGLLFVCVALLCLSGGRASFIGVDDSYTIEVGKSGVFYLDAGKSQAISDEYFITGELDVEDLTEYLTSAVRTVTICIKDGDKLLYSRHLGNVSDTSVFGISLDDAVRVIADTYESWATNGVVPKDTVRYTFLCFYLDV